MTAWRLVFQNYTPKNVHSIKRDWIYDNILLKDDDGRVFKPPSFIPPYAPEFFMDLPVTNHPREFRGIFRTLIPKINRAFMRISFNDNDKCKYEVSTRAGVKDLGLCSFNDLYDSLLFHRKPPVKPWKTKWENEGIITREDWNDVWMNVHHQSINQATQSSLWIMLHRNFMCAYFAKLAYNEDGVCKLCKNVQLARTHIFTSCQLLSELYDLYFPIINHISTHSKLVWDLETIKKWAYQWKMQFNPDISKQAIEVVFSHKYKKPDHPTLSFNDIPVKRDDHTKHLGFFLDSRLNFRKETHCGKSQDC